MKYHYIIFKIYLLKGNKYFHSSGEMRSRNNFKANMSFWFQECKKINNLKGKNTSLLFQFSNS